MPAALFQLKLEKKNNEKKEKKRKEHKPQSSTKQKQQGLERQGEGYLRTSCFQGCVTNPKVESLLHATHTGLLPKRSDEREISWQENKGI